MNLEKKFVRLKNGEELAYIESGEGIPLLLIHGNMSSSAHFWPLLQRLPKGIRAIAPDLRGFGDSSYNQRFDSLDELSEDVMQFARALGIDNAHVLGWSTGGAIALILAAAYPAFVRSLISVEGASHRGYPIFKKNADFTSIPGAPYASKEEMALDPIQVAPCLAALKAQDFGFFRKLWDMSIYLSKKPSPDEYDLYIRETLKQRNLVDIDWGLAVLNMGFTANPYSQGNHSIDLVKCRCMFTSGDKDMVVPYYMVKENTDAVNNSITVLYRDCGHSPFTDCPDKLTEDILNFISDN